ncbi:hypothetical protein [Methylobacterium soli]|nr:hypothetical protein [Methylobacterium soli]
MTSPVQSRLDNDAFPEPGPAGDLRLGHRASLFARGPWIAFAGLAP